MSYQKIIPINKETPLDEGELIRHKPDGDCFMVFKIDKKLYNLISIYDDNVICDIPRKHLNNGDYEKVGINFALFDLLSTKKSLSLVKNTRYALDKIVDDYALQICINMINQNVAQTAIVEDYPIIVVAANVTPTTRVAVIRNNEWLKSSWSKEFLNHLNDYNKNKPSNKKLILGNNGPKTSNIVGNCAEQHAVNDLTTLYPDTDIDKIAFSKAIRPRTGEIRKYCYNCCELFNLTH